MNTNEYYKVKTKLLKSRYIGGATRCAERSAPRWKHGPTARPYALYQRNMLRSGATRSEPANSSSCAGRSVQIYRRIQYRIFRHEICH